METEFKNNLKYPKMEKTQLKACDLLQLLSEIQLTLANSDNENLRGLGFKALVIREEMVPNGMDDFRNTNKDLLSLLI